MVSSSIYHGIHYKESQEQCQGELLNEFGKKIARKVTSQCKVTGCWVLVVFNFFKNLSKNFIIYSPFLYFNSTYILSYKMAKKTSIFGKKVGK